MLLGRREELGTLRDLWMAARGWAGRALVVSGDPGIGKSALLEASSDAAELEGLRVLRTRGARSEAMLPFAALSALLRPIASRIAELPVVQAALLAGALGFAEVAPADPFAVAAAALDLLGLVSTGPADPAGLRRCTLGGRGLTRLVPVLRGPPHRAGDQCRALDPA